MFFLGAGSCLRYCAYRKMTAAKMVFVRFLADKAEIMGQLSYRPTCLCVCINVNATEIYV